MPSSETSPQEDPIGSTSNLTREERNELIRHALRGWNGPEDAAVPAFKPDKPPRGSGSVASVVEIEAIPEATDPLVYENGMLLQRLPAE